MKRLLLILLSLSVALAGCADNSGSGDDGASDDADDAPAPAPMSNEQARGLVERAAAAMPERYGFTMVATKDGSELMRASGTFDNATGRSHLSVTGSPAAFAPIALPEEGLSMYLSQEGAVYRFGDVAVVQASAVEQLQGIVPAQLLTPQALLAAQDVNLTVTAVEPVVWEDRPALRVSFRVVEDDGTAEGVATMLQESTRLVRLEATLPRDGDAGPLAGATFVADLQYEDEAAPFPQDALRLLGFGYGVRPTSGDGDQTWTFQQDREVALEDVVALVHDPRESRGSFADTPVALRLRLSDGTATAQGITLTFADADGDGLLSKGDTLTVDVGEDASFRPQVVLLDDASATYVTSDLFVAFRTLFGGF